MDAFSYLSVLLSVILGLAIQQVLQGYRALALSRRQVTLYWPSLAWSVTILAMAVQHWWSSFGLAGHANWTFAAFAAILVQTAGIYMMAALVLPDVAPGENVDLKAHYYRERIPFFATGLATISWSVAREWILEGRLPLPANLAFHLLFIVMGIAALASRGERLHQLFAGAMMILFLAYIVLLFARLA